jgi:hypothetical protein
MFLLRVAVVLCHAFSSYSDTGIRRGASDTLSTVYNTWIRLVVNRQNVPIFRHALDRALNSVRVNQHLACSSGMRNRSPGLIGLNVLLARDI